MIDLKNTYIDCKGLSADERMIYLKACIGDDLPHKKMCGYGAETKEYLLLAYKNEATFLYCSDSGMISLSVGPEPCIFGNLTKITLADLKHQQEWSGEGLPPVGVECEKWFSGDMVVIVPMSYVDDVLFYKNKSTESYDSLYDWCYHGNCDFKLIETPEQKAAREELESAYDLYCEWVGFSIGVSPLTFDEFNNDIAMPPKWIRVVRKAGYRKQE